MKTLKLLIAILAISTGVAHAQFVKAELQVSGLTCSMCSKATEKSLRTLPFISNIQPDLNRNLFTITFKPNMPVNIEQIGKKVQGAGFSVNQFKAVVDFDKVKVNTSRFSFAGDTYQVLNPDNKDMTGMMPVTVVNKGFAPSSVIKKYNSTAVSANASSGNQYQVIL